MKRAGVLKRTPMKAGRTDAPDALTRSRVYFRSGFACEACSDDTGPFALHHRQAKAMGGSSRPDRHALSNLLLLCSTTCHPDAHAHPADAREHGWIVSASGDPRSTAVLWRGREVLLCDDGTVEDLPPDPWGAA